MRRTDDEDALLGAVGARVRERRQELGWSLGKLGEVSELHWTYVGQVERGGRNVSLINIARLATALQVDVSSLVHGLK